MEFIDLKAQFRRVEPRIRARMDAVLAHGRFVMGPEVGELEARLAALAGAKHCLTCASGTTALDLVLMAWNIGPGDAVFTTPLTFVATAESIARTGATPVFADIGADYNMDVSLLEPTIEAVLRQNGAWPLPKAAKREKLRPRAVIPVDLFGSPADYDALLPVARKYDLLVLEDAAQGFGGSYRRRPLCGCGCHAATTSFFPAKPLGCYGDGGAVFTDDGGLAALVDSLRYHGRIDARNKNDNARLGLNGRMDTLQAAVVLAKLEVFADELEARREAASRYAELLRTVPGVAPPPAPVNGLSTWAQYTLLLPAGTDRARVMKTLLAAGIPTAVNYPKGLHVQGAFAGLGHAAGDFPRAADAAARVLSLPMHPYLDAATQERIVEILRSALDLKSALEESAC
ncbi:MAG: DegT/DnrJ/EryC1/StrS family aminotransferase [Desulfovibrio sp.]|nr:DegT/DnrJ/EryC1/StrS family aminotransferase [Desulfovibrio sp.]